MLLRLTLCLITALVSLSLSHYLTAIHSSERKKRRKHTQSLKWLCAPSLRCNEETFFFSSPKKKNGSRRRCAAPLSLSLVPRFPSLRRARNVRGRLWRERWRVRDRKQRPLCDKVATFALGFVRQWPVLGRRRARVVNRERGRDPFAFFFWWGPGRASCWSCELGFESFWALWVLCFDHCSCC